MKPNAHAVLGQVFFQTFGYNRPACWITKRQFKDRTNITNDASLKAAQDELVDRDLVRRVYRCGFCKSVVPGLDQACPSCQRRLHRLVIESHWSMGDAFFQTPDYLAPQLRIEASQPQPVASASHDMPPASAAYCSHYQDSRLSRIFGAARPKFYAGRSQPVEDCDVTQEDPTTAQVETVATKPVYRGLKTEIAERIRQAPNHPKKMEQLGDLFHHLFGEELEFVYGRWSKIWTMCQKNYGYVATLMLNNAAWDTDRGDPTNAIEASLKKNRPDLGAVARKIKPAISDDEVEIDYVKKFLGEQT